MSRRPPNPAAERAAQNQQTIKSLLKLEPNKICADCKRNKRKPSANSLLRPHCLLPVTNQSDSGTNHIPCADPRWASWNLGVFVCIRCSGIHRGMGTHISRVKSVDLDSWTDEQLQSILSWGNSRANKYWEAKLAAGHAPSEAKIENFIRTKYELKRWVMDGPMPDPSTLDADGDDDIPLSVVKEKQNVEKRESVRKASIGQASAPRSVAPPPQADLMGTDPPPIRASTTGPPSSKVAPKAEAAPPKTTSTKDSLLGLDFLGTESPAPPRPASTTGTAGSGGQSRPDLKQSILSLYAAAPRPQPPPQQQQQQQQPVAHSPSPSFGGMQSPGHQNQGSFGGLNDAFGGLSFGNQSQPPKSPPRDAFAGLGGRLSPQTNNSAFSSLSGGSFFDPKPAPSAAAQQPKPAATGMGAFGGLSSPTMAAAPKPAPAPSSSALGDLFDFSSPAPQQQSMPSPPAAMSTMAPTTTNSNSVFNLTASPPKAPEPAPAPTNALGSMGGNLSGADVWGSNAWATPEAPKKSPEVQKSSVGSASNSFGWGASSNPLASQSIVPGASGFAPAPKVAADEEFGGWASSAAPATGGTSKPVGGLGANEDLFSNVWQ